MGIKLNEKNFGSAMIHQIHELVWGPGMLVLFLLAGIVLSIRIRLFQVLHIPQWWRNTVGSVLGGRRAEGEGISPFQSACTALAATIGTGNIAGVATALLAGGPGAVFWMWVSAFLGMATAYGETALGIRYRVRGRDGKWMSGPMLYLERGIGSRGAGILYAVFCMTASFGMGSMVQANAIAETLEFSFSFPEFAVGGLLVGLAGCIITGGAEAIARTSEKLVPVSAGIYLAASLTVILLFYKNIPAAFTMILRDAFTFDSAAGGIAGYAVSKSMRYGIARGVFSNEAGLGSMAILNGGADGASGRGQGQWAIFEVFFDTIVSCSLTAFVILCALGEDPGRFAQNGAELTSLCFAKGLGNLGGYLVSVCVVLFAFATIIAWYYMGKQAAGYLGEALGRDVSGIYITGYLLAVFLGSLGPMEAVWEISDIFNGMMAVPNLLALLLLVRKVERPLEKNGGGGQE